MTFCLLPQIRNDRDAVKMIELTGRVRQLSKNVALKLSLYENEGSRDYKRVQRQVSAIEMDIEDRLRELNRMMKPAEFSLFLKECKEASWLWDIINCETAKYRIYEGFDD